MIAKLEKLPLTVRAMSVCTAEPEGDFYTILLNKDLNAESQMEGYMHEEKHIALDHFHDDRPLEEKEAEARG